MRQGKDCICNRCSVVIDNPHPDRIAIYHHTARVTTDYRGIKHTHHEYICPPGTSIHLCNHCKMMFGKFMKGETLDE